MPGDGCSAQRPSSFCSAGARQLPESRAADQQKANAGESNIHLCAKDQGVKPDFCCSNKAAQISKIHHATRGNHKLNYGVLLPTRHFAAVRLVGTRPGGILQQLYAASM